MMPTGLREARPLPPHSFYAYVVVISTTSPPQELCVELSRKAARERIRSGTLGYEPETLRIRRARVTLYGR